MIFPSLFPPERAKEDAEKLMFDAFSRMPPGDPPDDFDIFYNTEFSGSRREENPDYEVDFIVADLRNGHLNGIVCIEVKGGVLSYNGEKGWTQNSDPMKKSPTSQVITAMHNLIKRFPEISSYVPFGWMVCFPDVVSPGPENLPPSLNDIQIIDKLKTSYLRETLCAFFDNLNEKHPDKTGVSAKKYEKYFRSPLKVSCDFVLPLSVRISGDEQVFIQLTRQQSKLLRAAKDNKRILVKGTAGTGKTILAKETATDFYNQGLNVLFLCFNSVLAANIEYSFKKGKSAGTANINYDRIFADENMELDPGKLEQILKNIAVENENEGESKGSLRIDTYHSFACSQISRVDHVWWNENIGGPSFWEFEIAAKIEEIAKSGKIKDLFDVVIIDEGQDFEECWFESLDSVLKPEARRYIFMDMYQNINQAISNVPDVDSYHQTVLDENCRSTRNIVQELSRIIDQEIFFMEGTPEGEAVRIIPYKSDEHQQILVLSEIRTLLGKGNVRPEDILILMNTEKEDSCLANTKQLDDLPLRMLGNNGVLSDTNINYTHIRTFKGLEANIVIIIDTDKGYCDENMLYTQASRGKHVLCIFKKSEN